MALTSRGAARLAAVGLIGGLVVAPLTALPAAAAPASNVTLNLLGINDFHGHISTSGGDHPVQFAGTVESLKAQYGASNTLFLSAGDNIGASPFVSSHQNDEPTIDVLNALGLQVSAVGNHEFDKGFSDLTGHAQDRADWSYLGANVYTKGTTTPALPEYAIEDVAGVKVGVIGAVTEEAPTLVAPGGISGLDFGDPVVAVNRVAAELTDGDPSNGEADVLVATFHEGASEGTPDGATLDNEVAAGGAFAEIVNDVSPKVSAIFTGHTHKEYAWDAPMPGEPGVTRPIVQTGDYGLNVGHITLSYDTATGKVTSHTLENVPVDTTGDPDAIAAEYPAAAAVQKLVTAAESEAAAAGNQSIGAADADITTAYVGGSYVDGAYAQPDASNYKTGRDDRASESTLGNFVADALLAKLSDPDFGGADIGVVNPGGLRDELLKGDLTYAEANAVLPFMNNLWTTTLTGAQFKDALEEQWQLDADGNVPTRPFLNLGLSNNVTYTYDPDAAQGEHITSITINGKPYDPSGSYRIGSFNFLLEGGDNFRTFAEGTDTRDSGYLDRDAWISYLSENSPSHPSFARRGVAVSGLPTSPVEAGSSVSLTLAKLNLTSLGSPANTTLTGTLNGSPIGSVAVDSAGGAEVTVDLPEDLPTGDAALTLVAEPSGTTVSLQIPVTAKPTEPTTPPTEPTTPPTEPTTPPTQPSTPPTTPPTSPVTTPTTPAQPTTPSGSPSGSPVATPGPWPAALHGGIWFPAGPYQPGESFTITLPHGYAGVWVSGWVHSTAAAVTSGYTLSSSAGTIIATLPDDIAAGTHTIVVQDASGAVIGWREITVTDPLVSATSSTTLPTTGTDAAPGAVLGSAALGVGALLVLVAALRRRRSRRA